MTETCNQKARGMMSISLGYHARAGRTSEYPLLGPALLSTHSVGFIQRLSKPLRVLQVWVCGQKLEVKSLFLTHSGLHALSAHRLDQQVSELDVTEPMTIRCRPSAAFG